MALKVIQVIIRRMNACTILLFVQQLACFRVPASRLEPRHFLSHLVEHAILADNLLSVLLPMLDEEKLVAVHYLEDNHLITEVKDIES